MHKFVGHQCSINRLKNPAMRYYMLPLFLCVVFFCGVINKKTVFVCIIGENKSLLWESIHQPSNELWRCPVVTSNRANDVYHVTK